MSEQRLLVESDKKGWYWLADDIGGKRTRKRTDDTVVEPKVLRREKYMRMRHLQNTDWREHGRILLAIPRPFGNRAQIRDRVRSQIRRRNEGEEHDVGTKFTRPGLGQRRARRRAAGRRARAARAVNYQR